MAHSIQNEHASSGTGNQWEGSIGSPENLDTERTRAAANGEKRVNSTRSESSRSESNRSDKGMISQASGKLLDAAEQQKTAATTFMSDMAGAVRRAAGEFDTQVPQAADYIRYAADQIDSVSDAVQQRDVGRLVSDLQSFARRQPTAFLGATFLAGFAAVRFFKSSPIDRDPPPAAMKAAHAYRNGSGDDEWNSGAGMPRSSTEWRSPRLEQ